MSVCPTGKLQPLVTLWGVREALSASQEGIFKSYLPHSGGFYMLKEGSFGRAEGEDRQGFG